MNKFKLYTLLAALACALPVFADTSSEDEKPDYVYVPEVHLNEDGTGTVEVWLNTYVEEYNTIIMNIYLPDGFTIEQKRGNYVFKFNTEDDTIYDHVSASAQLVDADGRTYVRMVGYSPTQSWILSGDRKIFSFNITGPSDYNETDYGLLTKLDFGEGNQVETARDHWLADASFAVVPYSIWNREPTPTPIVSISNGETIKVGHFITISKPEGVSDNYKIEYTFSCAENGEIVKDTSAATVNHKVDLVDVYTLKAKAIEDGFESDEITVEFTSEAYELYALLYHTFKGGQSESLPLTYSNDERAYKLTIPELRHEFRICSDCEKAFDLGADEDDENLVSRNFDGSGNKINVRAHSNSSEDYLNLSERYVTLGQTHNLVHGSEINFSAHSADEMQMHSNLELTVTLDPVEMAGTLTAKSDEVIPTGVADITVDGCNDNAVYFNLQGIRIAGKPDVPGIYLRADGTKLVIK